jgi:hypothetical protein
MTEHEASYHSGFDAGVGSYLEAFVILQERVRNLEGALMFYARGGDVAEDMAAAARGDIDLAQASEALTEDCGDIAREALKF